MCEVVGDRPSNVVEYPESEREYLRYAVMERRRRKQQAMPDL